MSDREQVGNYTVRLEQDTHAFDPRHEFDHLGTMVCWHSRYELGDYNREHPNPFATPEEFMESEDYKNAAVILPLALLDHSGITMYVGSGAHACDPGGWDSGQVGWIYVTREKAKNEMLAKRLTKKVLAKVEEVLRGEVEEYDQYLTGDVYGYIVEDEDGETVDSCWGFFGHKYALQEGIESAKHYQQRDENMETCIDAH